MLDVAEKYIDKLRIKDIDKWYNEKYKYYYYSSVRNPINQIDSDGDYEWCSFTSINWRGDIIGCIGYLINRISNVITSLGAISYSDNIADRIEFSKNLHIAIDDIFCKFNHHKIEFDVIIGNPVEKIYDKIMNKYGGKIVGTYHDHVKLIDNKYYDAKVYEIFRDEYIKNRPKRFKIK